MFSFGTIYYFAICFALFKLSFNNSLVRQTCQFACYSLVYTVYVYVFLTNPGLVLLEAGNSSVKMFFEAEDIEVSVETNQADSSVRMQAIDSCSICRIYKETNVTHCRACNTCIRGIDHHCIAFGKCIAWKNLFAFRILIGGIIFSVMSLYYQGFEIAFGKGPSNLDGTLPN